MWVVCSLFVAFLDSLGQIMAETKHWVALEANPEILTEFTQSLGGSSNFEFTDVYGFDADLLSMVPRPVHAVLLLFPIDEHYEKYRLDQQDKIKKEGQTLSDKVYFMNQTIGNACGTIGVIHSVLNNYSTIVNPGDGFFQTFYEKTKNLNSEERGAALEQNDDIEKLHSSTAEEGQSKAPSADDDVDLHFVAFVHVDGYLYELDGRKPFPVNHGVSSADTVLEDSVKVIQQIAQLNPNEVRFTMLALVSKQD